MTYSISLQAQSLECSIQNMFVPMLHVFVSETFGNAETENFENLIGNADKET